MTKPRIFLGSSGKQAKLLQALTRGLEDVAQVEPWTTSFNPGTTTLERLLELTQQVDFAAFVFARDDWTAATSAATPTPDSGQASPRDNVVFEAGLFGGVLGMAGLSFSTRAGRSCPVISSVSPASGMMKQRQPQKCASSTRSFERRSRMRARPAASRVSGGSFP